MYIVGFVGCNDERNNDALRNIHKGVVIKTNSGDSILSFTLDVNNDIHGLSGKYGTYSINPIGVPYKFSYSAIDSTDERYVKIAPIIDDAMHQPCRIPDVQVNVVPVK